jgi:hypothetical protein
MARSTVGLWGLVFLTVPGFRLMTFCLFSGEKDGKCSRGKLLWGGVIRARGRGEM